MLANGFTAALLGKAKIVFLLEIKSCKTVKVNALLLHYFPGYCCFLALRSTRGGGIACLVRSELVSGGMVKRVPLDSSNVVGLEICAKVNSVEFGCGRTLMLGWYWPPENSSNVAQAERQASFQLVQSLLLSYRCRADHWQLLICGDTNSRVGDSCDAKPLFDPVDEKMYLDRKAA